MLNAEVGRGFAPQGSHPLIRVSFKDFEVMQSDDRSVVQKSYDRVYATISYVSGVISKVVRNYVFRREWIPLSKIEPGSRHLYVFIHGLDGSPLRWSVYVKKLELQSPEANYIIYPVPKKGDCGLREASEPLVDQVKAYIRQFPNTESICLIGKSNGTRIAARVERQLSELIQSIHTASISGVHQGTRMMAFVKMFCSLHPKVVRDLTYRSERSLLLLDKWRHSLQMAKGPRSHFFYVSLEDEAVVPPESGLVRIGTDDQHFVFRGYTHRNLADVICDKVLVDCQQKKL